MSTDADRLIRSALHDVPPPPDDIHEGDDRDDPPTICVHVSMTPRPSWGLWMFIAGAVMLGITLHDLASLLGRLLYLAQYGRLP